jgi:DNA-binding IclR family transcriptional regulator
MRTIQTVERSFALLELLDSSDTGLGIREMARQLGLHPSNVQRLVNTLLQLGYVEPMSELKRYRLSYKALFLGHSLMSQDRLIDTAIGELNRIASEHEVGAYLAVLRDARAVYLLVIQGSGLVSVRVGVGDSAKLHSSAMGKALLTGLTGDQIKTLVGRGPLPSDTKNTIRNVSTLLEEIERVRACGYSISNEENYYGIVSVGAPVRDYSNKVVAAVSVAFPLPSNLEERITHLAPHVIETASRISRGLGWQDGGAGRDVGTKKSILKSATTRAGRARASA